MSDSLVFADMIFPLQTGTSTTRSLTREAPAFPKGSTRWYYFLAGERSFSPQHRNLGELQFTGFNTLLEPVANFSIPGRAVLRLDADAGSVIARTAASFCPSSFMMVWRITKSHIA